MTDPRDHLADAVKAALLAYNTQTRPFQLGIGGNRADWQQAKENLFAKIEAFAEQVERDGELVSQFHENA